MKKFLFVIFFLLVAGAALVATGIIPASLFHTPQPETHKKVDVGFIELPQASAQERVPFESVIPDTYHLGMDWEAGNARELAETVAETTQIKLIRGHDLDSAGNATTWLFIVRQPDKVSLVTYDKFGQKVSDWPGTYPDQAIIISEIIKPQELFSKNQNIIFPKATSLTEESRELAIAGDSYYLTITDKTGKKREVTFNTKTGAMVSSND